MRVLVFIMVVAFGLLPFYSSSQNYYNVYFMQKKDTLLRAVMCTKTIAESKTFAALMSKDYGCTYKVVYWKRRPKSDDKVNYLIWKWYFTYYKFFIHIAIRDPYKFVGVFCFSSMILIRLSINAKIFYLLSWKCNTISK